MRKSRPTILQDRVIVVDRPCPISSSTSYTVVGEVRDTLLTGEHFPLLLNNESKLLITGKAPREEDLPHYYESSDYISHARKSKSFVERLYRLVRAVSLPFKYSLISPYLSASSTSGTLLDVGCGMGHFARYASKKRHQVIGIEQSEQARCYVQDIQQIPCYDSLLSVSEIAPHSIDLITLWHVLEHISTLSLHFERFRALLKERGILLIALPNCASYDCRKYKNDWAAYDAPRHLWHFTPSTIKALAEKEGFDFVRSKTMPLDAFYISLLSEKNRGSAPLKALARAMITGTVGWFRSLLNKEEASSLVYIFQKR